VMFRKFLNYFILAASLVGAQAAFAVCTYGDLSVEEELRKSLAVFVGRVLSEEFTPASKDYLEGTTYIVMVEEVFRGSPAKEVGLFSENSSGRFPMTVGFVYLVFASDELGRLTVYNCGNSGEISEKAEALSVLRKLK
jgi:hypothetical protein